ncbi:MAG: lytic transglycosylase domain-containing protein [Chloroflexota bacterium]
MPRARSNKQADWQTAAPQENGSGCLSLYSLSILAVFLITGLITALAFNSPIKISAASLNPQTDSTSLSPIFTREVQHWSADIIRWANASALDPNLVAVILQIESCGNPSARSGAGAMGLFQVMPFHFRFGENPYDPETNALRGLNYLARSLQAANGDARLALAGYNGGIGVIARSEWTWQAETKRYVYYGAPIYEDARNGAASSVMLDEWYRKYGAGLCRDASKRLGLGN